MQSIWQQLSGRRGREWPKWAMCSHMSTVLRAHQTAGLLLPWLPTLPTKFIAVTVCVDWTVFLTLTSPFNPQPLWNPVLSAVDLGAPSFIYLIKHLSFVQQPRMQKHHLAQPTSSFLLSILGCVLPPTAELRQNPPTRTQAHCARAAPNPGTAPLPAAPLAQPVNPCCPTAVQAVYYPPKNKVIHSPSLMASKLDSNHINMILTLHISMKLFFSPTSDLLIVKEA